MPNRETHFNAGGWCAALNAVNNELNKPQEQDLGNILRKGLFAYVLGGIGGSLPDILEPAHHPNHRKSFHSVTAAALVLAMHNRMKSREDMTTEAKEAVTAFSIGFGSHLVLDAGTPKCIPLI